MLSALLSAAINSLSRMLIRARSLSTLRTQAPLHTGREAPCAAGIHFPPSKSMCLAFKIDTEYQMEFFTLKYTGLKRIQ